ncbi:hypothetical protein GCM10008967_12990 [Bacillus carboniphilus]|uniref:Uncharacterized protein n=1 Tax=Bacillus carboniphilus TaxID=86663 RepID=A0ABN0W361_9BACI
MFPKVNNSRNEESELNRIINQNQSRINQSGNSDVDVNVKVEVDTKPIAYALLVSLLSTNQLSRSQFNEAVNQLDELLDRSGSSRRGNSHPWFRR